MQPIESKAILAVGYDRETQVLRATFRNGGTYDYFGVPPDEYGRFMSAESRGAYMNQVIKPRYEAREV